MDQSSGDSRPMSRFGGSDLDIRGSASGTFDPSFTAKMSKMMQVPKKIQICKYPGCLLHLIIE